MPMKVVREDYCNKKNGEETRLGEDEGTRGDEVKAVAECRGRRMVDRRCWARVPWCRGSRQEAAATHANVQKLEPLDRIPAFVGLMFSGTTKDRQILKVRVQCRVCYKST